MAEFCKVISNRCEHGKTKRYCKECSTNTFCSHKKQKRFCKECGGSNICEHKRDEYKCKECGGTAFCRHGRYKDTCKECGGSKICTHGKIKYECLECGGRSICEHNKRRSFCKDCGGGSICKHNRSRSACNECFGGSICEHKKLKHLCRECGGSSLCKEHNHIKTHCVECGGSRICPHKKRQNVCIECNGSLCCVHKKLKYYCKECDGSRLCKSVWCETFTGNKKYEGYCLRCFVNLFPDKPNTRNYKTKEKCVVDNITESFPQFTWVADKRVQDGCSKRRPDLLLDLGSHIIIVEVDENKHTDYDCSCEHKRLMELSQDLQHRPIVFIRFNPDDYTTQDNTLVKSCWKVNKLGVMQIMKTKESEWKERMECLKRQIQYWIDNPTEKTVEIVELFY